MNLLESKHRFNKIKMHIVKKYRVERYIIMYVLVSVGLICGADVQTHLPGKRGKFPGSLEYYYEIFEQFSEIFNVSRNSHI